MKFPGKFITKLKILRNEIFKDTKIYVPFSNYSRTNAITKLYDRYFYSKYGVNIPKDLLIYPKGDRKFHPRFQNFKRENKHHY